MPTNLPTTKKAEAFARRLATAQVKAKGSHSHIDLEASGKAVAELAFTDEVKGLLSPADGTVAAKAKLGVKATAMPGDGWANHRASKQHRLGLCVECNPQAQAPAPAAARAAAGSSSSSSSPSPEVINIDTSSLDQVD